MTAEPLKKQFMKVRKKACASCAATCDGGENSEESQLMICARCRHVSYCSRVCQRSHWKAHKSLCKGIVLFNSYRDAEAINYLKLAAEDGNAHSMYLLSLCYLRDKGVGQDMDEYVQWSQRAAEGGHAPGQMNMFSFYLVAAGSAQDYHGILFSVVSVRAFIPIIRSRSHSSKNNRKNDGFRGSLSLLV